MFTGPLVAGPAGQRLAGKVGTDDVDREPVVEEVVEGGELAGELGHDELTAADGNQQAELLELGATAPAKATESMPRA